PSSPPPPRELSSLPRAVSRALWRGPSSSPRSSSRSSQPFVVSPSVTRSRITVRRRAILRRACGMVRKFLSWRVASLNFASKSSSRAPRNWSAISLSDSRRVSFIRPSLLSRDELRFDRELVGRKPQRLFRERAADAADLEDDAPRSHHGHPVVGRTLARSHPHLGGLLGDGLVRKHVDPDRPTPLEVVRHRAPGRFDLAGRHPARLHGLEGVVALRDPVATL